LPCKTSAICSIKKIGRWAQAVLHTHSVWSTVLSDSYDGADGFWIEGYEMLKGLEGIQTHEHKLWLPIFENTQDIKALSVKISAEMTRQDRLSDSADNGIKYGSYT
jgi:methylthioribulose-1-phosphate dehydratase